MVNKKKCYATLIKKLKSKKKNVYFINLDKLNPSKQPILNYLSYFSISMIMFFSSQLRISQQIFLRSLNKKGSITNNH